MNDCKNLVALLERMKVNIDIFNYHNCIPRTGSQDFQEHIMHELIILIEPEVSAYFWLNLLQYRKVRFFRIFLIIRNF